MTARRHTNLTIRGVTYRNADHAAAEIGVCATAIRSHARAGTLHRVGLGLSGPESTPVSVRGHVFESPAAVAAYFKIGVDQVYRRLEAGTPDTIGLPNNRGARTAKTISIGPVRFRSYEEASRALGFGRGYVGAAMRRKSPKMQEKVLAAAMRYAANSGGAAA